MCIKNKWVSAAYKFVLAIFGLWVFANALGIFRGELRYAGIYFFTNLSNLFCGVYFLVSFMWLLTKPKTDERTTLLPFIKGLATLCITVTMLVSTFMLKMGMNLNLLFAHYIVPIMTLLDWALFDRKGQLKRRSPIIWISAPLAYFGVIMLLTHLDLGLGYPYPFLNIEENGVQTFTITIICMIIGVTLLGYVFYAADYFLGKKAKKRQ